MAKKRVLSGVQPSGQIHLGNYFGAIKQHIALQKEHDCYYFIADYHALTTQKDAKILQQNIRHVAMAYLALGLDTACFYRQSDIVKIPELALLLSMVSGMGELERCHAYKDKIEKGITPSVGLFYYPILMAADILIVRPDLVPVGGDQAQHLELARDIATHFATTYNSDALNQPTPLYSPTPRILGTKNIDGKPAKMSKSYGNTVDIFAPEKTLKKQIMSIETSSASMESELDTETCLVFNMYSLFVDEADREKMTANYKRNDYGYGHAKKALYSLVMDYFAEARLEYAKLEKDPVLVDDILRTGAQKANTEANRTMEAVRSAYGID